MRLDTSDMPENIRFRDVQVGDVFRNQRGVLMVVIAITGGGDCCLVMFSETGVPTGVQKYGVSYLRDKLRVGTVEEMPTLQVSWEVSP